MDAAQLQSLSARLDAVLELEPAEREAALDALPPEEAARLRRLLADATPLEGPPPLAEAPWVGEAGERVGPYRLLRPLGRGGMGEVWLAARADGAYERDVALKRARRRLDAQLAARMQVETQVAARLEHRHIARLYEAGVDEAGWPWIASECIDGRVLDRATPGWPAMERLRLLLKLVRAVAYAHGRGVLHRDLKPANVMVDGEGEPHLLDFGVAALSDEPAAEPAVEPVSEPETVPRALTPGYAAPERLAGAPDDVRADVYSLGVMGQELMAAAPLLDAARAADLAAILARATATEPAERYDSATSLGDDLQRCLRAEPVLARPLRWHQRTLRTARRHWLAAAAALVVVLALAGAGFWSAHHAARSAAAQAFLTDLFATGTGQGPALIDQGAQLVETRFADQPELRHQLFGVMAQRYRELGDTVQALALAQRHVQSLPADASGASRQAALLLQAQAQLDAALPKDAAASLQQLPDAAAPEARVLHAAAAVQLGRFDEAEPLLEALDRELPASGALRARQQGLRAEALQRKGQIDLAVDQYESAATLAEQAQAPALAAELLAKAVHWAAQQGHKPRAQALHQRSQALLRSLGGPHLVRALLNEAGLWVQLRLQPSVSFAEADAGISAALAQLQVLGPAVPARLRLGVERDLLMRRLDYGDLGPTLDRLAVASAELLEGEQRPLQRAARHFEIALVDSYRERYEAAEQRFLLVLKERAAGGMGVHPYMVNPLRALARNATAAGWRERALAHLDAAPSDEQMRAAGHDPAWYRSVLTKLRARVLLDFGEPVAALRLLDGLQPHRFDREAKGMAIGLQWLRGEALCTLPGRRAEGLALLRAEWQALNPDHHPEHPDVRHARQATAACERRAAG